MIITLAGHVDHGKTSLVQALTGVNTDRLEEEKRRGLTIDLGFAYLRNPETNVTLGFVDVPGHHRFIHNMVAGISAHQHALLVIAADDGPMPQSREHLQILNLLGIDSGTIALTKCDRVSDDQRLQALTDIEDLVRGSCLEQAEVFETSVESGEGLDGLKASLLQTAGRQPALADADGEFRLAIDRAFTIAGAGVVVTGTVHSGQVSVDDSLTLYPSSKSVRVKGVRSQDQEVTSAGPGDRCALNLTGVDIDEVSRGQWLASDVTSASCEFSLQLAVLDDFPRPIRHWLPVHVYHATSHTTGHIALLSQQRVSPGEATLVELVTEEPLLLRRDDRLVLRDQGLDRTLGGGAVVSVQPAAGRRRAEQRLQFLAADALTDPRQSLATHLDIGAVALVDLRRNLALSEASLQTMLTEQDCELIDGHAIRKQTWQAWQNEVLSDIEQQHEADNALQGLKQSELSSAVAQSAQTFLPQLLAVLVAEGKLSARAGRFLPATHRVGLSEPEQTLFDRIEPLLNQPQPPSLGDMAKQFRLGVGDLAKRLHPLVAKHYLVRISDTRYYLPGRLGELASLAKQLDAEQPFTVRQYRDAAAIGRNVAIEVLEHFDRIGFTRRDADTRRVIGDTPR